MSEIGESRVVPEASTERLPTPEQVWLVNRAVDVMDKLQGRVDRVKSGDSDFVEVGKAGVAMIDRDTKDIPTTEAALIEPLRPTIQQLTTRLDEVKKASAEIGILPQRDRAEIEHLLSTALATNDAQETKANVQQAKSVFIKTISTLLNSRQTQVERRRSAQKIARTNLDEASNFLRHPSVEGKTDTSVHLYYRRSSELWQELDKSGLQAWEKDKHFVEDAQDLGGDFTTIADRLIETFNPQPAAQLTQQ